MDKTEHDLLMGYARLKRENERIKREYILPIEHEAQIEMLRQEVRTQTAWAERYRLQNERLRADLKANRPYQCCCCLHEHKKAFTDWDPCRGCTTKLSSKEDHWVYKEPI